MFMVGLSFSVLLSVGWGLWRNFGKPKHPAAFLIAKNEEITLVAPIERCFYDFSCTI
jgi:hypothetical protein